MHKVDVWKLFSFYKDSLEEEDLRGLSFNTTQVDRSFILGQGGAFLLEGRETELSSATNSPFWQSHEIGSETKRLYLGYPILIHENEVSPLYFLEADVQRSEDGRFSLRIADSSASLIITCSGSGFRTSRDPQVFMKSWNAISLLFRRASRKHLDTWMFAWRRAAYWIEKNY